LLERKTLEHQGLFVVDLILKKWQEHQSGHRDWSAQLWGVLMVQAWLERHFQHINDQRQGRL
jgi:asparagine synthase (glutamine-hydrolysing)